MAKLGYRYSYGKLVHMPAEKVRSGEIVIEYVLVNARVIEEAQVFDGYCRDCEVNLTAIEEQAAHLDHDLYRSFFTVFRMDNGDEVRKDDVLDRNGYCAMHSGHSKKFDGDTPADCVNPHDHCVHGTYVGGCGIDWMCGQCENGWEE